MKKNITLYLIILFTLTLSHHTAYSGKDEGLKKLQTWLKSLKKNYTIQELKKLKKLDLMNNQFKRLPKEIGNLKALTKLYLKGNHLKTLPKEIGNLKALTKLNLYDNQLKTLPKEIGNLKALTLLLLGGNPLSDKEKEKIKKLLPKCYIFFD